MLLCGRMLKIGNLDAIVVIVVRVCKGWGVNMHLPLIICLF